MPAPDDQPNPILEQLVIVPDVLNHLAQRAEVAERWDGAITGLLADNECEHGRLSGDRTPPCGCWGPETPVPDLFPPKTKAAKPPKKDARLMCLRCSTRFDHRPKPGARVPNLCPKCRDRQGVPGQRARVAS